MQGEVNDRAARGNKVFVISVALLAYVFFSGEYRTLPTFFVVIGIVITAALDLISSIAGR